MFQKVLILLVYLCMFGVSFYILGLLRAAYSCEFPFLSVGHDSQIWVVTYEFLVITYLPKHFGIFHFWFYFKNKSDIILSLFKITITLNK